MKVLLRNADAEVVLRGQNEGWKEGKGREGKGRERKVYEMRRKEIKIENENRYKKGFVRINMCAMKRKEN